MALSSAMIDAMVAAGLTPEQMAALIKADLSKDEAIARERRDKAAAKKRRQRATCSEMSLNVPGTDGDNGGQTGTDGDAPSLDGRPSPQTPYPTLYPSRSDPNGSGSMTEPTDPDPRRDLFGRGLSALCAMTGKAQPQARTLLGRWLKTADDSAVIVLIAIDEAAENNLANPVPWIEQKIRREVQRNGSGSTTLFDASSSVRRSPGPVVSSAAAGLARALARRGVDVGQREDLARRERAPDRRGSDSAGIEDVDWTDACCGEPARRRA